MRPTRKRRTRTTRTRRARRPLAPLQPARKRGNLPDSPRCRLPVGTCLCGCNVETAIETARRVVKRKHYAAYLCTENRSEN